MCTELMLKGMIGEVQSCDIVRIDKLFQVVEICDMAKKIWNEHYASILEQEQIDYMLQKFQSPNAIGEQIKHGYYYCVLSVGGVDIGYISYIFQDEHLYLSKFYISNEFRRKGYGGYVIEYLKEICSDIGLSGIRLNVNKYNGDSISAYKNIGFKIIDEGVFDIGGGYVMDDYIMLLEVH